MFKIDRTPITLKDGAVITRFDCVESGLEQCPFRLVWEEEGELWGGLYEYTFDKLKGNLHESKFFKSWKKDGFPYKQIIEDGKINYIS